MKDTPIAAVILVVRTTRLFGTHRPSRSRDRKRWKSTSGGLLGLALGVWAASALQVLASEPLESAGQPRRDPVARLWDRLETGEVRLPAGDAKPFLRALLRELDVPEESQVLVFSKTSLQNSLISPATPRAIYFSEEAYVGWCQGGLVELIGIDPIAGPQFYTLEVPYGPEDKPELATSESCLSCHEGSRTAGVRGMLVRSVYTDGFGQPLLRDGSFLSSHESPLAERWGGWYVTGRHGSDAHMGNAIAHETPTGVMLDRRTGANQTSLEHLFSAEPYLTKSSDLVALMVLEHQCTMHNLITAAGTACREAMARQQDLQRTFGEPITSLPQGSAVSIIQSQAEKILTHLLFAGEYRLRDDGVEGAASFQDAFRRNRHASRDGRSLKDFQLLTRLFKYRCSYMIYSQSFEALPLPLRREIYHQLQQVLTGADERPEFAHLSASERASIRHILAETKPEALLPQ